MVGIERRDWDVTDTRSHFLDGAMTRVDLLLTPIENVTVIVADSNSEAFLERCFAADMTTRSTPRADSRFRESSEASW